MSRIKVIVLSDLISISVRNFFGYMTLFIEDNSVGHVQSFLMSYPKHIHCTISTLTWKLITK